MPETREIAAKITADHSVFRRQLRQAGAEGRRFGSQMETVGQRVRRAWRDTGLGRVSGQVKSLTMQVGGLVGVYGISQGIRRVRDFEEALGDLAIQGSKSNKWMDEARETILKTSSKWGIMKDQVAGFASALVTYTGDAQGAVDLLDQMGLVATASGAKMESLAGVVFQLTNSLKLQKNEIVPVMGMLRQMGKMGTMEFGAIAAYGGRVFPRLSAFGRAGMGISGARAAGGLLQVAARGYSKEQAGEAATATSTFLKQLFLKRDEVRKKLGVQVQNRDLIEVFKDLGRVMQDQKKATEALKIFAEGGTVAQQLGLAYGKGGATWQKSAGTIFGAKATSTELAAQAQQKMEQRAHKWKRTMVDLDNAMHKALLPVMKKLVEIMPKLAKSLKWAMENARTLLNVWLGFKAAGVIRQFTQFIRNLTSSGGGLGGGISVPIPGRRGGRGGRRGGRMGTGALSTAATLAGPVGWIAAATIEGPQLVQLLNKATGGPDIGMPILGGHGVFEARGAGRIRAGDVPGLTKSEKKKWADLETAWMKADIASLTGNVGAIGSEVRPLLRSADYATVYKRGGKRGVRRKLQELMARQKGVITAARGTLGVGKSATLQEIENLMPIVKELSRTIATYKAAVEAFNQGKRFVIKVDTGDAEKRTKQRATGAK